MSSLVYFYVYGLAVGRIWMYIDIEECTYVIRNACRITQTRSQVTWMGITNNHTYLTPYLALNSLDNGAAINLRRMCDGAAK